MRERAQEDIMAGMKTVLAVDDDPDIIEFVKSVLSKHYRVVTGFSGKECLDLVGTTQPDVILLDVIMMHLGDGLDCLRTLKQNPATKDIPVIMMTSVSEVYDYRSQIEESFFPHDRWLDKPVKADVLLKNVREVLGE
jgi:putative two-component system response regulator